METLNTITTTRGIEFNIPTNLPNYIKSFAEIPADRSLFGGKLINLAEMTRSGLNVPPGFGISTEAYEQFLTTGSISEELLSSVLVLKKLLGGKIALRSSATIEDAEELSQAGVFETVYLNEEATDEDVAQALTRIYSQARSSEVQEYAALHGLKVEDIKMGLAVQEFVDPKYSGVIYTSQANGEIIIQYLDDTGDKLVDQQANGATVIFDSHTRLITQSQGFDVLPLSEQEQQGLLDLAEQSLQVFDQKDQDIEFVIASGGVYTVQSRPHTTEISNLSLIETDTITLEKLKRQLQRIAAEERTTLGNETVIFTNSNFVELMPNPTEMDFGVFATIFSGFRGQEGAIQKGRKLMGYPLTDSATEFLLHVGHKPYMSLARDAATYYAGFPETELEYRQVFVAEYLDKVASDPELGLYPEMGLYVQDPSLQELQMRFGQTRGAELFGRVQAFQETFAEFARTYKTELTTSVIPALENFVSSKNDTDISTLSNQELADSVTNILSHLREESCLAFVISARLGFYYTNRIQELLTNGDYISEADLQNVLSKFDGLEGNFGFSENIKRAQALLTSGLSGSKVNQVVIELEHTDDENLFIKAQELIPHYCDTQYEALEIRHPRLIDEPDRMFTYAKTLQSGNFTSSFAEQQRKRQQFEAELLRLISDEQKREQLKFTFESAQTYMAARETVKYHFTQEYMLIRKALIELQSRFSNLEAGDIFFVYPDELGKLVTKPESMNHLIKSRKQSFANSKSIDIPNVFSDTTIENIDLFEGIEDFDILEGLLLSDGPTVEAMIINIEDYEDEQVPLLTYIQQIRQSDVKVILVAKQMNLTHDPLIGLADGLVLENAAIASHGAQRAREYGKGGLGGIRVRRLKTGTMIKFDPKQGTITKLS